MSWVCAQVSISRAVSEDAALMAGPNQGRRWAGSMSRKVPSSSWRAASNQASIWAPPRSRNRAAIVSGSMPPAASASASSARNCLGWVADRTVTSSK